ncbi:MAG: hypothetical protein Q4D29_04975 [Lachnospiraceae bacterium]|nr:hypothetical protein [Lachnospiraceae bacterium]
MFCKYCGADNENDAIFCCECGQKIVNSAGPSQQPHHGPTPVRQYNDNLNSYVENIGGAIHSYVDDKRSNESAMLARYDVDTNSPELRDIFVDTDEKLIAKLGNGFLVNLLVNKHVRRCFGLLSNKRVYLKGTFYSTGGGKINEVSCMQILDVEDITGTGFIYSAFPLFYLVLGIASIIIGAVIGLIMDSRHLGVVMFTTFIGVIAAIICLILGFIAARQTQFFIEYAGGRIKFDATTVGIKDVQDFQKQIRRVKDKVNGKI